MAELFETRLPGVGMRHEFTTSAGERVVVLLHKTGRREVAIYNRADRNARATVLHLSLDDTRTLVDLLGGNPVCETVAHVQELEGVAIDWIRIPTGSTRARATIDGDRLQALTGASIVAIVRDDDIRAAPVPDFVLHPDDLVVVVGRSAGLLQLREILES